MRTGLGWLLLVWTVVLSVAWIASFIVYPEFVLQFGPTEILFLMVGGVLTMRVRESLIGPVLVVGASAGLLYDIGTAYAKYSIDMAANLPLEHFAAWLGAWTGPLGFLTVPLLLVLFPDGRFTGSRRWFLPFFAVAIALPLIGSTMIWDAPSHVLIDQADGGALHAHAGYGIFSIAFPGTVVLAIPAAVSLFMRFGRGIRLERQQIKWLLASAVAIPIVLFVGLRVFDPGYHWFVTAVPFMALPIAVGVAVLRYRLYDLDRLVSRSITYSLVIGVLGAAVFLVAAVAGAQFEEPWIVAATTLGVAAVFNPLRKRLQVWVDRRFNRSRYDAERVAERFAGSLRDRVEPDRVIDGWVGVVGETMQPSAVGVWVRES